MTLLRNIKVVFLMQLPLSAALATGGGPGVTYHGRLMDPAGMPVVAPSVQFKIQLRSPGPEDCLFYEEIQTKDLSTTDGVFSVTLFDGTGTVSNPDGFSAEKIFSNRGVFAFSGGRCSIGSGYSPAPYDSRNISVSINDGAGWEAFSPSKVSFVPMSLEAMQVGGYSSAQLIKVADGVSTTGTEFNSSSWAELLALLGGTSLQYVRPGATSTTISGTTTFTNATAPQWNGSPSGANDLVNKSYVDAQVSAGTSNVGTPGTYTKVTTDTKGRVTVGTSLAENDIPNLVSPGKVSAGAINAGTMVGSAAIDTSGNLVTTGTVQGATVSGTNIRVFNGPNYVQLAAPALGGNLNLSLPAVDGANGNLMKTNGAGQLSFGALGASDIPGLDTSKITTGVLPVTYGGTGSNSYGINRVIVSNGTGTALNSLSCAYGQVIKYDISGYAACGADDTSGGATGSLSSLTAAVASNSIENGNFPQIWNWGTATSQSPLSLSANALTTGSLLSLTTSSGVLNSTNGILDVANTGISTSGKVARIQANSTMGSGLTVLANGNVGVGTSSPGASLDIKGVVKISGATSGAVGFAVPPAAGSATYTWPGAPPASNKLLQSDAAGTLSWVSGAGGGDALVANPLSQFAATTSSQLAGVLSDETGTGAAVFASSPTLSGVPLTPTAAADTNTTQIASTAFVLGQASATGPVMNGTQMVGTSLKYSREDHVHPSDTSRAPAAGSASITTLGTVTTGTWNGATIAIANGGTGATTAAAARSNLGLGTAATVNTGNSSGLIPTVGATGIGANLMCTGDGTGVSIVCNTTVPTGNALTTSPLSQFAPTSSTQLAGVLSDETGTGAAVFGTSPTFMTNITSPLVIGGTGTTSTLTYKTTTGVGAAGADHIFKVGNNGATEAMRILNNGNVGMGTTSPAARLEVNSAGTLSGIKVTHSAGSGDGLVIDYVAGTGSAFRVQNGLTSVRDIIADHFLSVGGGSETGPVFGSNVATSGMFFPNTGNDVAFATSAMERMRINPSGNVGIGTITPATTLQVNGVISPAIDNTFNLGNPSYRFSQVFAVNGVINTSDRREKKDVYDTDLGLEFINKLRPVSYRWITGLDTDVHYGLIAQEAEQVIAEFPRREPASKTSIVVHDEKSDKYGVRYSELVSPLIKAAQELYARIRGIDRQIASVSEKISSLEADNEIKNQAIKNLENQNAALKAYLCEIDHKAPICK